MNRTAVLGIAAASIVIVLVAAVVVVAVLATDPAPVSDRSSSPQARSADRTAAKAGASPSTDAERLVKTYIERNRLGPLMGGKEPFIFGFSHMERADYDAILREAGAPACPQDWSTLVAVHWSGLFEQGEFVETPAETPAPDRPHQEAEGPRQPGQVLARPPSVPKFVITGTKKVESYDLYLVHGKLVYPPYSAPWESMRELAAVNGPDLKAHVRRILSKKYPALNP